MKKHIHREVRFDMAKSCEKRHMTPIGPVFNLGSTPRKWWFHVEVVIDTGEGLSIVKTDIRPEQEIRMSDIGAFIADELTKENYDNGVIVSIPVRAVILP